MTKNKITVGLASLFFVFSQSPLKAESAQGPITHQTLLKEMGTQKKGEFLKLIQTWKKTHGSRAVSPLLEIAKNPANPEKSRTIAILGASELAASQDQTVYPNFKKLLQDPKWLIRFSAIKGLEKIRSPLAAESIAEKLKDPALVVRSQAADTLARWAQKDPKLVSPKTLQELSASLSDPKNYHQGKALWVPQRALAALIAFEAKSELKSIGNLIEHSDEKLAKQAVFGLEKLTGQPSGKRSIADWKAWISQNSGASSN